MPELLPGADSVPNVVAFEDGAVCANAATLHAIKAAAATIEILMMWKTPRRPTLVACELYG